MKQLTKQQLIAAALGSVLTIGLGAGAIAFADTNTGIATPNSTASTTQMMRRPGAGGTVTAISGNTITIANKDGKTYTIDASSAKVTKDETASVSDIAVGDTIMASGTMSGTSVTATSIHDGQMPQGRFDRGPSGMGHGIHGA